MNGQTSNDARLARQQQKEYLKMMEDKVCEQELSARSWVAMDQKMKATISVYELQDQYDEVVAYNEKKMASMREEINSNIDKAIEQSKEPEAPTQTENTLKAV